jgi:hypothetical protein
MRIEKGDAGNYSGDPPSAYHHIEAFFAGVSAAKNHDGKTIIIDKR